MLLGNSLSKEFPEMFKYLRFPKSFGISPVKLLLLTSRKLKFGSIVSDLGIEPTNLLF
jgi:hypothetical protein